MLWRKLQLNWRYAFGEFSIILLGVLAALAVDSWNSDRKDRFLEREYLLSLLDDFDADKKSLDNAMRRTEEIASAQQTVLMVAERRQFEITPAEFVYALSEVGLLVFATPSRRTIDDLMSTGNLRIIESDEVRTELVNYYSRIEHRAQWQHNWREYQIHLGKMLPEIINWQGREALSFPDLSGLPPWVEPVDEVSQSEAQEILDRLIAHPGVLPAIENMLRIQSINYQYNNELKKRLLELIETVEAYLGKLENR
jgi:hypothetical protein